MTVRTADGKKVSYNVKDKAEYDKYNPIQKIDPDTGEVTFTNANGTLTYKAKLRERATPRSYNSLSTAQIGRAKAMASSNYTLEEIASKLGVSPSTISKALKGVK